MTVTVVCADCGRRRKVDEREVNSGIKCATCKQYMDVDRASYVAEHHSQLGWEVSRSTDRPWRPMQIFGVSFLFGPGASGTVAGLNFARMGRRQYLFPTMLIGWGIFLVEVFLLMFVASEGIARLVAQVGNLVVGIGFAVSQMAAFDSWKSANWRPAKEGERYKPSRIGQLFLVSLLCLAIEVGVIFLLAVLGGKW